MFTLVPPYLEIAKMLSKRDRHGLSPSTSEVPVGISASNRDATVAFRIQVGFRRGRSSAGLPVLFLLQKFFEEALLRLIIEHFRRFQGAMPHRRTPFSQLEGHIQKRTPSFVLSREASCFSSRNSSELELGRLESLVMSALPTMGELKRMTCDSAESTRSS